MILLISTEFDRSTDEVIDWLNYFGSAYLRINKEDIIESLIVKINNNKTTYVIKTISKQIDIDEIRSFWYRKNGITIRPYYNNRFVSKNTEKFIKFLKNEKNILEAFIEFILSRKYGIGYVKNKKINKLLVLQTAKECGLEIPETLITNRKEYLKHGLIIKAISEGFLFKRRNKSYLTYTKEVNLKKLSENFNPTLFQRMIEKEFELRIFYLKEKIYSMAIFSQNDDQTKLDFRHYNWEKPNRTIPFLIPESLKEKIIHLMNKLGFNTGSLDFIVDKRGNYIFLEVNPSGQFGMVSKPCNYYLEKEVAKELIRYEN